jgi:hypothetical protein
LQDLDVTEREVLVEGLDDWIGLWRFAAAAREAAPRASVDEIRHLAMRSVRKLVNRGYLRPGRLVQNSPGFEVWELSPSEALDRIDREWRDLGRDPSIPDICWFTTTEAGDRAARALVGQIYRDTSLG